MAWNDQFQLEAVKAIDHRMADGMTKREALAEMSKESDIPVGIGAGRACEHRG